MNLENIKMQLKEAVHKRQHILWFHLHELSNTGKSKEGKWLLVTEEREEWEVTANGHSVPFWGDKNILKLDSGNNYTTLNILKITELYILKW